jgi:hypothetical protein
MVLTNVCIFSRPPTPRRLQISNQIALEGHESLDLNISLVLLPSETHTSAVLKSPELKINQVFSPGETFPSAAMGIAQTDRSERLWKNRQPSFTP